MLAEAANSTKKGGQELIGGLDVRVHRNHFGRQVDSFETSLDLRWLIHEEASSTVEKGVVIRATPGAGTVLTKGDAVSLWVSTGTPQATVPKLEGLTLDAAKQAISEAKLKLGDVTCDPGGWVYADGNAGAGDAVQLIVPGDSISKECTFDVTAAGDNLTATLTKASASHIPLPLLIQAKGRINISTYQLFNVPTQPPVRPCNPGVRQMFEKHVLR